MKAVYELEAVQKPEMAKVHQGKGEEQGQKAEGLEEQSTEKNPKEKILN